MTGSDAIRNITLNGPITTFIGPNGSGKTQLLRALRDPLRNLIENAQSDSPLNKRVRFLSAGRMGMLEQYRSNYDGHRQQPRYDHAVYGTRQDSTRRLNYETLLGDFHTLSLKPDVLVKVRERLRKLFGRDIRLKWDAGNLKADFVSIEQKISYGSAREASGLMHLAGLLAALYDDDVGALIIDEPEVSLHPQLQAFLMREIRSVAGIPTNENNKKLILLSTHSTEFIGIQRVSDIPHFIFCESIHQDLVQVEKEAEVLQSKKIAELVSRIGQEHRLALFSKSPLLVEGPSDAIISGFLCNKFDIHIEAGGSQILPVIGKGEFPTVVKFLRLLGKSPVILADADAFVDSLDVLSLFLNSQTADEVAAGLGAGSARELIKKIREDFLSHADNHFGLIEELAKSTLYWKQGEAESDPDPQKVHRRAAFSAMFSHNPDELPEVWRKMRTRLETALNILEGEGCFILRRGAIESYYSESSGTGTTGKPYAASEEVLRMEGASDNEIAEKYDDLIRALKYSAQTAALNESSLIRDQVLAIVGPIVARLRQSEHIDLNEFSQTMLGDAATIYSLSVNDGVLVVSLTSRILELSAFPLKFDIEKDPVDEIGKQIEM
ncbi:ATP-dependent endonuclease [Hyphomonas sp. L-53-1-40]|uniref:ATP-dependent nuclease n=1 Tax=Hyphomonas sp. L-53-1-40 TaxID=1207058 RepID=UPI0018DD7AA8|nr:AAA family ATPase [Hyphomonas sp. L-53-1-40]